MEEEYVKINSIRPDLCTMFCTLLFNLAQRSECNRMVSYARTSAIIVSPDNRQIIGFGYNGREARGSTCPGDLVGEGNCGCIHAEVNAMVNCQSNKNSATMYTIASPCENCARVIINSGIDKVVYIIPYRNKNGLELLERHGVWIYQASKKDTLQTSMNSLELLKASCGL